MKRKVEALLFASDQPLSADRLSKAIGGLDRSEVKKLIEELQEEYDRDAHAFTVVEFGGGYSISTRQEHAKLVSKLFRGRRKQRLSKAALEALAIIAYKQPVTRLEIEEIRGVAASGVLATLLERDLIQIAGRAETLGHPLLYSTTKTLLDYLGLKRIQDLPQLSELEDLLAQKEELKQIAKRYGDDVEIGDEDFDRALTPDPEEADGSDEAGEADEAGEVAQVDADGADSEPIDDQEVSEPLVREASNGDAGQ